MQALAQHGLTITDAKNEILGLDNLVCGTGLIGTVIRLKDKDRVINHEEWSDD